MITRFAVQPSERITERMPSRCQIWGGGMAGVWWIRPEPRESSSRRQKRQPAPKLTTCDRISGFRFPSIVILSARKLTISIKYPSVASNPRILTSLIERVRALPSTSKVAITVIIDCSIANGTSRNHDKITVRSSRPNGGQGRWYRNATKSSGNEKKRFEARRVSSSHDWAPVELCGLAIMKEKLNGNEILARLHTYDRVRHRYHKHHSSVRVSRFAIALHPRRRNQG